MRFAPPYPKFSFERSHGETDLTGVSVRGKAEYSPLKERRAYQTDSSINKKDPEGWVYGNSVDLRSLIERHLFDSNNE